MKLEEQTCEACRPDAPVMTDEALTDDLRQLPGWSLVETGSIKLLEKNFQFKNFVDAMSFAATVGELAEQENHHPSLLIEWGRVRVQWWTHKIGGVHKNDAILAARTEFLLGDKPGR